VRKSHQLFGKNSGFTILEIFVIIAVIFILAAVIFPRFVDFDNQIRLEKVGQNMTAVQMAANAYAINNNGHYPIQPDDPAFRCYLPGGNCNSQSPKGGNYPENPFTHKVEPPLLGKISDVKQARQLPPTDLGGSRAAGKIFYNVIIPSGQKEAVGYAIEGADQNGMALAGKTDSTCVLSNL
jgi:type II secretory pathway pseudopilin PulG